MLLWGAEQDAALLDAIANVQPFIDGLLANAEHLNQVVMPISCVYTANAVSAASGLQRSVGGLGSCWHAMAAVAASIAARFYRCLLGAPFQSSFTKHDRAIFCP